MPACVENNPGHERPACSRMIGAVSKVKQHQTGHMDTNFSPQAKCVLGLVLWPLQAWVLHSQRRGLVSLPGSQL